MYPYHPYNRSQDYAAIIGQAPPQTPANGSPTGTGITTELIIGGIVAAFAFGVGSALGAGLVTKYILRGE